MLRTTIRPILITLACCFLVACAGKHRSRSHITDPPLHATSRPSLVEIMAIKARLDSLDATPIGQQVRDLADELEENDKAFGISRARLEGQLRELCQTPQGAEYKRQALELTMQYEAAMDGVHKTIHDRALALYSARQKELRTAAPAEMYVGPRLGFDVTNYPRIDGSTSTHPLCRLAACRLLKSPYAWEHEPPTGSFRPRHSTRREFEPLGASISGMPVYYTVGEFREFRIAGIQLRATPAAEGDDRLATIINQLLTRHSGTNAAYKNLIERKADLALVARKPSADELKLARAQGVTLQTAPIALDALVFLVNDRNPVRSITREQARDIYRWRTMNWKELGGLDQPIRFVRRDRNSGSQELMEELILGGQPMDDKSFHANESIVYTMSGPYDVLTQEERGIGFSVYYYEHFMAASPYTRTLAIDGVEPSADTIATGRYLLVSEVYAAWRSDQPQDSKAIQWLNWLKSEEGQSVVRESGYVPIRPPTIRPR